MRTRPEDQELSSLWAFPTHLSGAKDPCCVLTWPRGPHSGRGTEVDMGVSRGLSEQGGHGGFFWEVAANWRTVLEENVFEGRRLEAKRFWKPQVDFSTAGSSVPCRWPSKPSQDGTCTVVPALRPECSQRRPGVEPSPSPAHCSQLTGSC